MTITKQDTAPSSNSSLFRAVQEKINKVDRATEQLLRRMENQVFPGQRDNFYRLQGRMIKFVY